jgi:hypothetical protein
MSARREQRLGAWLRGVWLSWPMAGICRPAVGAGRLLRNPAYAGTGVFGKTMAVHEPAGLNRIARLQGRSTPRPVKVVDRPRDERTGIPVPVPPIVSKDTSERVQQRLVDNNRLAARNTKVPSLLQGLAACSAYGYGYYRTSSRTTNKTITTTGASAAMTTAPKVAGSATTSPSAPTTSTPSSGTTSPACSPSQN